MRSVVSFVTPGHLDLEAIRTFGINAKPKSDNPIGFFGTLSPERQELLQEAINKIEIWE